MRSTPQTIGFELSTSGRDDGTVEAFYVQLIDEPVSRTQEILRDTLIADYAEDGRLVGVEVIAPVKFSELDKLVEESTLRQSFHRFLANSAPRDLVLT